MRILHAILPLAAAAAHIRHVDFKGLDGRFAVLPESLYYVRSAYACHYGIPVNTVAVESLTWYNMTSLVLDSYHINDWAPVRPLPCTVQAATHWSDGWPTVAPWHLVRSLVAEEPMTVTVRIDAPIGAVAPLPLNMLPFLAAAVDERYAELLGSPDLFVDAVAPGSMSFVRRLMVGDAWTLISVVVALHLIGMFGICCIRRETKRRYSDPTIADMV